MPRDLELTIEQLEEFKRHTGLVHAIVVRKYNARKGSQNYDDLYQFGCLGLVEAIKKSDPAHPQLRSYYGVSITNAIFRGAIQPGLRQKRGAGVETLSLEQKIKPKTGKATEKLTIGDLVLVQGDFSARLLDSIANEPILEMLLREAPTYCRHELDGEKWHTIAQDIGITNQGAQHRAKSELKKVLEKIKKMDAQPTAID